MTKIRINKTFIKTNLGKTKIKILKFKLSLKTQIKLIYFNL